MEVKPVNNKWWKNSFVNWTIMDSDVPPNVNEYYLAISVVLSDLECQTFQKIVYKFYKLRENSKLCIEI